MSRKRDRKTAVAADQNFVQPLESRVLMSATTSTLISIADSTLRDGSYISKNFGHDSTLGVQKSSTGFQRQSYVKFGLDTVNGDITSAVLTLYGRVTTTGSAKVPVNIVAVADNDWTETGITWGNKPAASTLLGTMQLGTSYTKLSLDVTNYVANARANGASFVSFDLVGGVSFGSQVLFYSRENGSNQPALKVTADAEPAPTTAPDAPTGLSADQADGGVSLTWDASTETDTYNVYRTDVTAGDSAVKIKSVTTTDYLDTSAQDGHTYKYTVRAQNAAGISGDSNVATISLDSTVPTSTGKPVFSALSTPGLAVKFSGGTVKMPSGQTITVNGGTLQFDPLPVHHEVYTGYAPQNWDGRAANRRWGDASANLMPAIDTIVLGGPYHQVLPGSVVVQNGTGTKTYVKDVDYKLNIEWGQVGNYNSRLGVWKTGAVKINYDIVFQRLDLIELLSDGTMKVKEGTAAPTVPVLPTADPGAVALAGIHVNTLDGAIRSGFSIKQRDIFPIAPKPTVAPIRPGTISKTISKLDAGKNINIAFFGDSITAGAESSGWFHNRDRTWTSLVSNAIQSRYGVTVTQTMAHESGVSAVLGGNTWNKYVLQPNDAGKHVDLVIIAMGMNDFGKPTLDPYKNALRGYINDAKARGIDVLMMTTIQSNPYYDPVIAGDHVPRSVIAQAMRDVGTEKNVAVADAYTEWVNQASRGIAPVSQLHNYFNHPGNAGHKLIANTVLQFFPG
jgi:lysophospholipase L1-like esterase